jgi:hypothetical protein
MVYRKGRCLDKRPLSDRIYTPIVNCHEVKMNSDGFQYDSRLPFQLPSNSSLSKFGFFRRGRTSAFLNTSGTVDSVNDLFTISLIIEIKVSKHGLCQNR